MDIDLDQLRKPCACGRKHDLEVKQIHVESGACGRLTDILENYQNPVLICDSNTRAAAEPYLEEEFKDYPVIELNPDGLRTDNRGVEKVMKQLDYCDRGLSSVSVDVLVAIGAGTIHDLTRYAAYEYDIPFVSIPTAASVDGFASNVAALTWDGMKKTVASKAPSWILADTDIFAKAPARLTASGVGDLMGKYTALLDWRISHIVTGEYICRSVCEMEERMLREVERELDEIGNGEEQAMEKLMCALLFSGLAIQMIGNSRPASGAEHHVSHLWEMEVINPWLDALHGEKVGIGLLLVTDYYKRFARAVRRGGVRIKGESAKGLEMDLLENTFGKKGLLEITIQESTPNPLEDIDLEKLEEELPKIADLIDGIPSADELAEKLKEAGAVTRMAEIGQSEELRELTLRCCPYVRSRLTLLRILKLTEWD